MISLAILSLVSAALLQWLARSATKDLRFQGGPSSARLGLASAGLAIVGGLLLLVSCTVIIPAGHVGVQVLFGRV